MLGGFLDKHKQNLATEYYWYLHLNFVIKY